MSDHNNYFRALQERQIGLVNRELIYQNQSPPYEYMIGVAIDNFQLKLPREIDVLKFFYHFPRGMNDTTKISEIVNQIKRLYQTANIQIINTESIRIKVKRLICDMKNFISKRRINSSVQKEKEDTFAFKIRHLLEVVSNESNLFEHQRNFLNDQRTERLLNLSVFENENVDLVELNHPLEVDHMDYENVQNDSDPDYSPSDDSDNDDNISSKKKAISLEHLIKTSKVGSSYRKSEKLLAIGIEISGKNPNEFSISKSTLWSKITKIRHEKRIELLKEITDSDFKVVIQFDGKQFMKLNEHHIAKEQRLVIICRSESKEIVLGAFVVEHTAMACAQTIVDVIDRHNLRNRVTAFVTDTEPLNTGRHHGAIIEAQRLLNDEILSIMCRHHVLEIILKATFETIFGVSSGPKMIAFDVLIHNWNEIKRNRFTYDPIDENKLTRLPLLKNLYEEAKQSIKLHARSPHVRHDYAEIIDLSLKFLNIKTNITFKVPGATSNARWLAKPIYGLKTYLFRKHLDLDNDFLKDLERFCIFISLIYIKQWNRSAITVDAPSNDLKLLKELNEYSVIDVEIANAGLGAFQRHMWYLSEELIPLAFFSDKVSYFEKDIMKAAITRAENIPRTRNLIRFTDDVTGYNIKELELHDFISPRSFFFFKRLNIDSSFLMMNSIDWENVESFKKAKQMIKKLIPVVNDSSERTLRLTGKLIDGQRVQSDEKLQDAIISGINV